MKELNIIMEELSDREKKIVTNPKAAFDYANKIIHGRWEEAEPYIAKDPLIFYYYVDMLRQMGGDVYMDVLKQYGKESLQNIADTEVNFDMGTHQRYWYVDCAIVLMHLMYIRGIDVGFMYDTKYGKSIVQFFKDFHDDITEPAKYKNQILTGYALNHLVTFSSSVASNILKISYIPGVVNEIIKLKNFVDKLNNAEDKMGNYNVKSAQQYLKHALDRVDTYSR